LNNRLSIHHPGGRTERRELKSAAEIASALEDEFGIQLPELTDDLIDALAKLVR